MDKKYAKFVECLGDFLARHQLQGIGIDPGQTGGLVFAGADYEQAVLHTLSVPYSEIAWLAQALTTRHSRIPDFRKYPVFADDRHRVYVEHVGGLPGDRPHHAFAFGVTVGMWEMLLGVTGLGMYSVRTRPEIWQTRFARRYTDERYCPRDRHDRKHFIWSVAQSHCLLEKITLAMADAAALAILAADGVEVV